MSDAHNSKKNQARYEPGELDSTRKNLGDINPEEAKRIAQLLGGEVGVEKSAFVKETEKLKRNTPRKVSAAKTSDTVQSPPIQTAHTSSTASSSQTAAVRTTQLPPLFGKEKIAMEKLLSNKEYHIIPNYGIFSVFFTLRESAEKVSPDFISYTLNDYIGHVQKFVTSVKKLIQLAPVLYKEKIEQADDALSKVLHISNTWDIRVLSTLLADLQHPPRTITVAKLIPLMQCLFNPILRMYYLKEEGITLVFKTAYSQISAGGTAQEKEALLTFTKEAISEWFYISGQIVSGLYPLLMRMCLSECVTQEEFFWKRSSKILSFLGLTKFDIILPQSLPQPKTLIPKKGQFENKAKTDREASDSAAETQKQEPIPQVVKKGLDLLDKLFPDAGWLTLDKNPDLYPYFQPMLSFKDGFNLLAPDNPLQVTLVLLRILEELFFAFRSINFTFGDESGVNQKEDSLNTIFNEWPLYHEEVFEKRYASPLIEYVNQIFAQPEFKKTVYAKKMLSNIMWTAKYYFLPHLEFEMVVLTKPQKDLPLAPFPSRVRSLKTMCAHVMQSIDTSIKTNNGQLGSHADAVSNPWSPYLFAVPNPISRRLDAILGGKNSRSRTNANLIYHTLLIVQVLDWWLNSKNSFAYINRMSLPYRTSGDAILSPLFSVPTREDLNEVFLKRLKTLKPASGIKKEEPAEISDIAEIKKDESPSVQENSASTEKAP